MELQVAFDVMDFETMEKRLDELKAGWLCRNKTVETGASSS